MAYIKKKTCPVSLYILQLLIYSNKLLCFNGLYINAKLGVPCWRPFPSIQWEASPDTFRAPWIKSAVAQVQLGLLVPLSWASSGSWVT